MLTTHYGRDDGLVCQHTRSVQAVNDTADPLVHSHIDSRDRGR